MLDALRVVGNPRETPTKKCNISWLSIQYSVQHKSKFTTEHKPPKLMTPQEQARFRILKALEKNPDLTQRELADEVGLSVGRTNYLINFC